MNYYSIIPVLLTGIGFLIIRKKQPGIIKNWMKESRPLISIHYLFPAFLGLFIGHHMLEKPIYYIDSFLLLCAIFFSFQTSVITNDIHDVRTDKISEKKTLSISESYTIAHYNRLNIFFFVLSLIYALVINYRVFLLVALGHVIHFLYSAKPFRLKRFYPLSILILSIGALLASVAGYSLYDLSKPLLSYPIRAALFITIPLFFGLNFRDLADFRGDKKTDVSTLFTICGLRKGKHVNAILLFISYQTIPLILRLPLFFLVTVPLGIASFYFCLREPFREKFIFYLYFLFAVIFAIVIIPNPHIIIQ
jgi:1,4-dihydroxy-2-naphthoate octaprenyltransferase